MRKITAIGIAVTALIGMGASWQGQTDQGNVKFIACLNSDWVDLVSAHLRTEHPLPSTDGLGGSMSVIASDAAYKMCRDWGFDTPECRLKNAKDAVERVQAQIAKEAEIQASITALRENVGRCDPKPKATPFPTPETFSIGSGSSPTVPMVLDSAPIPQTSKFFGTTILQGPSPLNFSNYSSAPWCMLTTSGWACSGEDVRMKMIGAIEGFDCYRIQEKKNGKWGYPQYYGLDTPTCIAKR